MTTPRSQVSGLGSAKSGTEHWWVQRLTAIALIPLTIFVIPPFASALGAETATEAAAFFAHPFNAMIGALFMIALFYHLKLGLQVVIEDYVHGAAARTTLLILNALGCVAGGFAGVFALLFIALGY